MGWIENGWKMKMRDRQSSRILRIHGYARNGKRMWKAETETDRGTTDVDVIETKVNTENYNGREKTKMDTVENVKRQGEDGMAA